ncbi:MAG: peptidylprolyl isomerase [Woeseiaceae bacterium]
MLRIALLATMFLVADAYGHDTDIPEISGFPQILVKTTQGDFVIELEPSRAPITVGNFLSLVEKDYYDGTLFHRVIAGFVAQGGGHGSDYSARPDTPTIINESGNGLSNTRGTIAMAREAKPHTANSQFFINLADNVRLDPQKDRWGYTVFGRVVSGMETLDTIAELPTGPAGPFESDVPAMKVVVRDMLVLSAEEIEARLEAEMDAARKALEALDEGAM